MSGLGKVEMSGSRYVTGHVGPGPEQRCRASNHRGAESRRQNVLGFVRACYADFGPTLAREKLRECHGLEVSNETLRKWMTEAGLWVPHARRRDRVQQPCNRRTCLGELIQIDGCDHEWFEERAARCTLLVYVDDATSKLMQLHFCDSESLFRSPRCSIEITPARRASTATESRDGLDAFASRPSAHSSLCLTPRNGRRTISHVR